MVLASLSENLWPRFDSFSTLQTSAHVNERCTTGHSAILVQSRFRLRNIDSARERSASAHRKARGIRHANPGTNDGIRIRVNTTVKSRFRKSILGVTCRTSDSYRDKRE